jgi:hypothetical protein
MSEENVPFEVLDGFPETGDLSDQVGGDVIEAAKGVRFTIRSVEPRVSKNDVGETLVARLNVRAVVSSLGIDGQGKYANKNIFAELMTWYNQEKYTSDWWKKQARFPYKSFLKAIGENPANPPKVTDQFLISLEGKDFIADIKKVEIRVKEDGKYVGTGDFKNELANFKAVEV